MAFTTIKTYDNERWDSVAQRAYGDPLMAAVVNGVNVGVMNLIIAANPTVGITDVLPGGINLVIPIIDGTALVKAGTLPPWKQL